MSSLIALGNWLFSFFPEYLLERWNGARFTEHEENERENDAEEDGEVNSENNAAESNQCLPESGGENMVNIHVHSNSGVVVIGDKSFINPPQVVHNVPEPLNELHENTGQQKNSKSAESSALQEVEVQHTSSTNALLSANNNKQGNENKIIRKKKKAAGQAIVNPKIRSLIRRFKYIQETLSQCRGKGEWKTHRETIECFMKEYKNDDDNYDIVLFLKYEEAVRLYQMNDRHSSRKLLRKVAGKRDQSTISETQIWTYVRCFLLVSDIYCQDKRFGMAKKALDEAKKFLVKFVSINQVFLQTEFHLAYARYYLEQVEQFGHSRQSCVENVIMETKKAEKVAKKDSSEMWKELHMEILMTRSNAILKLSHIYHDEHNEMLKESLEEMDHTLYNKSLPLTKVKFRSLKCCYYKMLGNLEQAVEQAKEGLEIAEKCEFLVEIKQLEGQIKDIQNLLSVNRKPCMEVGEVVRKVAHMITTDTGNVESNAVEQSCGGAFSTDDFTTDASSDNEESTLKLNSICGRNEVLEYFHGPVQSHLRSRENIVRNYSSCQDLVTDGEGNVQRFRHDGDVRVSWPADDEKLTEREQTRLATYFGSFWMQLLGLLNIVHETKENILRNVHDYPDIESQAKQVLHIYSERRDFSRKDLAKLVQQDLQLYDEAKAIISGKYQSLEEKKDIKIFEAVEGEESEKNEADFHGSSQTINAPADKEKLSEREQTRLAKHLNPRWSELLGLLNIDHYVGDNLSNSVHRYPDNISKAKEVLHIYTKRGDFSRKNLAELVKNDLKLCDEAEAILSGKWKSI